MMDDNKNKKPDKNLEIEPSEIISEEVNPSYETVKGKAPTNPESIIEEIELDPFENIPEQNAVDNHMEEVELKDLKLVDPAEEVEENGEEEVSEKSTINEFDEDEAIKIDLEEKEDIINEITEESNQEEQRTEEEASFEKKDHEDEDSTKSHESNFNESIDAGLVAGYVHSFNLNLGYQEDKKGNIFSRIKNNLTSFKPNDEQSEENLHSEEERVLLKGFSDPTIPLTKFPLKLHDTVSEHVLIKKTQILQEERIIVLTCIDDRIAFDTARSLAAQISDSDIEYRQLLGKQDKNDNIHVDIFMNEKIGQGQNTVVVVDVKSAFFFGSMTSLDYANSVALRGLMEEKNMYLIFTISAESRIEDIKNTKFYFTTWNISAIDDSEYFQNRVNKVQKNIPEKENLVKIILYTTTFFPGLNQEDFERIILIFLENINKGKKKKEKVKEEWFDQPDYYLNKCKIYKTYLENYEEEVIEFIDTHDRVFLKKHFNDSHSFYIRQKYEVLLASGLLFNITTNTQITSNLIDLILKKMSSHTKEYAIKYLHKLTTAIVDQSSFKINENLSIADFWNQLSGNFLIRKNAMAILAQLLDEMLSNSRLKEVVRGYLNFYMTHKRDIVQELSSELRYSPNFDKFYWIGRLLDEGDTNTRDKSFSFLVDLSKQIGIRIFDFLEEIQQWLPNKNMDSRSSQKSIYGLAFIIHYTNEITKKFAIKNFGHYPSRYPLFTSMVGDQEVIKKKIELILYWMFHPKLEGAMIELRKNHSDGKRIYPNKEIKEILNYKAYLIEVWYAILNWNIEEQEAEDVGNLTFISDTLIQQFCQFAPSNIRVAIEKIWDEKTKDYAKLSGDFLKQIAKIKDPKSPYRKQLLESREVVLKSFAIINRLRIKVKDITAHNKIKIES